MQLTEKQLITLQSICDTFVPKLENDQEKAFFARKASDLQIPEKLVELIGLQPAHEQTEFLELLDIFSNALVGLLFGSALKPFAELPLEKREKYLLKWSESLIPPLREAFTVLKKLTFFLYYAYSEPQKPNPNWETLQYEGALTLPPNKPKTIKVLDIQQDTELSCEVLIIGTGAGGGVVAGELAGRDVMVVEKGNYYNEADFNQLEADMIGKMYEKNGILSNQDKSCSIFAGSTLGGGTVINWAGSFRTPDYILEEWAKEHDCPHFLSAEYQESFDAVEKIFGVNTEIIQDNPQNQKLRLGSAKLGHLCRQIPQNIEAEADVDYRKMGYSPLGCQYGYKKSTLITTLQKASDAGTRFLVNTEIQAVTHENGKITGAIGYYKMASGQKIKVRIRAEKVVVSAGAVHTPALLIRSGLQHSHIGQHLNLHPVVAVSGLYDEPINPWWGLMMTATNDQFTQIDGNYGFKIETPPAHTGIIGMSLAWRSGKQHKDMMLKAKHLANFIILTRDRFGGSVSVDRNGNPAIHYKLNRYDRKHLLRGIAEATKIHLAAGAKEVILPHYNLIRVKPTSKIEINSLLSLQNWSANRYAMFSAHQMASCRMGGNSKTHPIKPNGETVEIRNLYVADASAFPKCSGANPMLSVQALAHWVARGL